MSFLGTFRSLRSPNYRIWAAGALVSNIGTWMQRTAQDWLVLTQLTPHNAAAVGIVMSLQFGPQLLLLPWTGFAADHYDQRKLLIVTQAVMGLLALTLGVFTITGFVELWHVYVFAFLSGCASAFDAPVRQIFVAELVAEKDLSNAIALNSTSFNMARMIGPAVAGLTIASVGTGWAFLLNGSSFFAVLASLFFLRVSGQHAKVRALRTKGSLTEGLRYVWARPDLKAILLMLFLIGTFGMNFPIFISTMAVRVFDTDARGYGLLSSTLAIGTIAGALIAAGRERPQFRSLLNGAAIFGIGCTLAALAPNYWLFAVALVIIGVGAMTFSNTTNSLMQLTTEPAMRGRVIALRVGVALGGTPIGAPIVGWVADHLGPRWALGVGAVSGILAVGVALYTLKRQMDRPASITSAPPTRKPEDSPTT
ncbi:MULTISPECIES: MFS transporter [Pseudomonas]|uniref:Integral membrane transport protein n=3 Tax=Gammaproteobacteria TaxID=1236 RepID=C3K034_PSEFS|nr:MULTISPECIES: MFS transporter [Pseudomonas]MBZ6459673.1 MFS transporter [Pseudomonas fluorescens group sp.]MBZ6465716.1 MFS transporter [Pseudomonas fluorescens group sp.]MBZ6471690.1 MFS transporter [Pseudomonas fluorescens group sp.]PLR60053.1 MFS transporter [Pseudomonas sp. QC2]WQD70608.1 MFS transporter [Pseudomonas marginalis]